jgi:pre-mRNA-splicing helicase BRR2
MNAMEMSQMTVQAMWDRDSPLKQIPHFSPQVIKAANDSGFVFEIFHSHAHANPFLFCRIKDIFELMEAMDPNENPNYQTLVKRLGLNNQQLAQAAMFTNNKYPNIDMEHELEDEDNITAGSPAYIKVKIEREVEEDEEPETTVHAPFYPQMKMENWWLVVGEEKSKSLLAIKRVTIGRKLGTRLEFIVPTPGDHELSLYLMCDSYVGVDQEQQFKVTVAEAMDEDSDEDEGEDE